jgi:beta-glucosidase
VTTSRRSIARIARTVAALLIAATAPAVVGAGPAAAADVHSLPYYDARLPVRERVADLLGRMTLAEKIGQMTQAERGAVFDNPSLVATWQVGSLLSGGGSTPPQNTPEAWADMIDRFQAAALTTRLRIPILYGIDSVHGDGNLLGATVFPHNIGLGATRDPGLVERIEHITAAETRATGPQWVFAPCICSAQDDRWGRTYESFGEDPRLVSMMTSAIDGFQGRPADLARPDRVLATAKHFAGDGDTRYDPAKAGTGQYPIDQGITVTDRADFWRKDLQQYVVAVRGHDVGSVMPSFSSVDWTEDGVGNPIKMHANRQLITGVLRKTIGFDGLVISDWEGIHQIPDPDNPTVTGLTPYRVRTGVNAGIDMFMEPFSTPQFESLLTDEVAAGRVPMSRIDDAVTRILEIKFELGLFEHPFTDRRAIADIGSAQHRAVARTAVAESQVLLNNRGRALPLARRGTIYVAGSNADDIGNQAGGWTITWQGESGDIIPGTTVLQGIRAAAPDATVTYRADASAPVGDADVGIVVVGETPYSEGFGDVGGPLWAYDPNDHGVPRPEKTMTLSAQDRQAIDTLCPQVRTCVVSVVSGRPLIIESAQLREIDALVASWLPGSEGEGVADVLFGSRPFTGRLPVTWPRSLDQEPINVGDADYDPLFPYGFGLRTKA